MKILGRNRLQWHSFILLACGLASAQERPGLQAKVDPLESGAAIQDAPLRGMGGMMGEGEDGATSKTDSLMQAKAASHESG